MRNNALCSGYLPMGTVGKSLSDAGRACTLWELLWVTTCNQSPKGLARKVHVEPHLTSRKPWFRIDDLPIRRGMAESRTQTGSYSPLKAAI